MTNYAHVRDGVVLDVLRPHDGMTLAEMVHPDFVPLFTPCGSDVAIGWIEEGGVFSAPPPRPRLEPDLVAYAANRRWQAEIGGITIGGVPIATDDRSKIMIMGARVAAAANPDWQTVWHGADGQIYPINAVQMIAISNAVEAHVNATFATFAAVKANIEAGDITSTAQVDAAFSAA